MKKTLIALATLASMTGVATAASVTLYGTVDEGLAYKYNKSVDTDGTKTTNDTYGLDSGNLNSSRWGVMGQEELGNGYNVGFKLESGFGADDGRLGEENTLFNREASLTVSGPFGALSAGRMGALTSGTGTYDIFQAGADVLDGGVGIIGTGYWHDTGRWNNSLVYSTPDMGGLKLFAQYSFARAQEGTNERDDDRYAGFGATFDAGDLSLVGVVDSVMYASDSNADINDNYTVSLGGHYKLGMATPFVGVQYGKHMNSFGFVNKDASFVSDNFYRADLKGYAVHLGSAFDLPTGTLSASLFYSNAKGDVMSREGEADAYTYTSAEIDKAQTYGVGLVNAYPLSKRTSVYGGVGYSYTKVNWVDDGVAKEHNGEVVIGLSHKF